MKTMSSLHNVAYSLKAYDLAQPYTDTGTGALFQYKDRLFRYADSHYKDKTVVRQSYLYSDNPYAGKAASLY